MKLQQKEQNLIMSKIIVYDLQIFLSVKKALCLDILSSYYLASVTEALFSDRNLCVWQNKFCDKNFFLSQKLFLSSMTKTCFSDRSRDRNLFLWWKLVPEGNFFFRRFFCLTVTCFLWRDIFLSKKVFYTQICNLKFDYCRCFWYIFYLTFCIHQNPHKDLRYMGIKLKMKQLFFKALKK